MKKISLFLAAFISLVFAAHVSAQTAQPASKIRVTSSISGSLKVNSTETVTWSTENFPADAKVNINLIKKTSDSPLKYELVRTIAKDTANDGEETWKVERKDSGSDLFIEVGCGSSEFQNGCTSDLNDNSFAVKGGFSASLAGVWEAVKRLFGFGK